MAQRNESQKLEFLRRNAEKGLPCGSEKFIRKLNWRSRRGLRYSIGHRDDRRRRIKRGASLLRCFTMKKGSVPFTFQNIDVEILQHVHDWSNILRWFFYSLVRFLALAGRGMMYCHTKEIPP